MDLILQWIYQYGYFGIFGLLVLGIVGLPVPDETLLVICGTLIAKGTLSLTGAALSALGGSISGITLSYLIGRLAGREFVHRWGKYVHFTEERQKKVQEWFDRLGHWLLTVGYFIPGVRHFTALMAGVSNLPYRTFAAYAYPGAVLWVGTFVTLGYYLGDNWQKVLDNVHHIILLIVIGGAMLAAVGYLYKRRLYRKRMKT
jgi:membrane protein DedA with SNARE-associated domain